MLKINYKSSHGRYLNGELMRTLDEHIDERVNKMVCLDDKHLAISFISRNGKLGKIIRIVNWKEGDVFGKFIGHQADVYALVKLIDTNEEVASGSRDLTIRIWHWPTTRLLKNLTGYKSSLVDFVSLSDFRLVICENKDRAIKVLNRSSGQLLKTLKGHSNDLRKVILLENEKLASTSVDRTIRIWNLTSSRVARVLSGHKENISALVGINKSTLASSSEDMTIKLWNINEGTELKTLKGHGRWLTSLCLLSNEHLASSSGDKTIRIWDIKRRDGVLIRTIFAHLTELTSLLSLPDGNLASGDSNGEIKIWYFEPRFTTNLSSKHLDFIRVRTFKFFQKLWPMNSRNF
jgi:WD40 repeat protein